MCLEAILIAFDEMTFREFKMLLYGTAIGAVATFLSTIIFIVWFR